MAIVVGDHEASLSSPTNLGYTQGKIGFAVKNV